MALILEGDDVISGVRDLLGPTDSTTAPAGTIRGDLGTDRMKNVVHASDSEDSAAAEIQRFLDKKRFRKNQLFFSRRVTAWQEIASSLPM